MMRAKQVSVAGDRITLQLVLSLGLTQLLTLVTASISA